MNLQLLPEKEARVIMAQIFQGLAYLNQDGRRIIHYDLKPGRNHSLPSSALQNLRMTVRASPAALPYVATLSAQSFTAGRSRSWLKMQRSCISP